MWKHDKESGLPHLTLRRIDIYGTLESIHEHGSCRMFPEPLVDGYGIKYFFLSSHFSLSSPENKIDDLGLLELGQVVEALHGFGFTSLRQVELLRDEFDEFDDNPHDGSALSYRALTNFEQELVTKKLDRLVAKARQRELYPEDQLRLFEDNSSHTSRYVRCQQSSFDF